MDRPLTEDMKVYAATDTHYLPYIAQKLVSEAPKSALKAAWDGADEHCQRLFKNAPTIACAKSIIKSKFDPNMDMPEVNIYFSSKKSHIIISLLNTFFNNIHYCQQC
jgi:hypothetical protein